MSSISMRHVSPGVSSTIGLRVIPMPAGVPVAMRSPGSSVQLPEVLPNSPVLMGVTLVGQAVTYNPTLTSFGLVASNATVLTLGF